MTQPSLLELLAEDELTTGQLIGALGAFVAMTTAYAIHSMLCTLVVGRNGYRSTNAEFNLALRRTVQVDIIAAQLLLIVYGAHTSYYVTMREYAMACTRASLAHVISTTGMISLAVMFAWCRYQLIWERLNFACFQTYFIIALFLMCTFAVLVVRPGGYFGALNEVHIMSFKVCWMDQYGALSPKYLAGVYISAMTVAMFMEPFPSRTVKDDYGYRKVSESEAKQLENEDYCWTGKTNNNNNDGLHCSVGIQERAHAGLVTRQPSADSDVFEDVTPAKYSPQLRHPLLSLGYARNIVKWALQSPSSVWALTIYLLCAGLSFLGTDTYGRDCFYVGLLLFAHGIAFNLGCLRRLKAPSDEHKSNLLWSLCCSVKR